MGTQDSEAVTAADLLRFAELAKKHPWYDPGASMAENLKNCKHFRGSKWDDTPGSIGHALNKLIREQ